MPFFTYNQNNSGGGFDFDEAAGISHYVIIEADSAEAADERAQEIGLYFDGVDSGHDCDCCGDRWYAADGDGDAVPMIYSTPVQDVVFGDSWDFSDTRVQVKWIMSGPEVYVHFADGRIQAYGLPPKQLG